MNRYERILQKCCQGDKNIRWSEVTSLLRHHNIYDTNPKKRGSHQVFSHALMDKNDPENSLVIPKPHGNRKFIHFRKAKEIADYIEMIRYYEELEGESEE